MREEYAVVATDGPLVGISSCTSDGVCEELKQEPRLCATIELLRHPDISVEDFEAQVRERVSPLGDVKLLRVDRVTLLVK